MPDAAIQKLNDARTDGVARVDESVEPGSANWEAYKARINELLRKPAERDPQVWAESFDFNEADEDMFDVSDLELLAVHEDERDKEWQNTVEAFGDAASSQAFAEILMIPLLEATQKSTTKLVAAAADAGPATVKKAQSETPGKQQYKDAKDRRKAKASAANG